MAKPGERLRTENSRKTSPNSPNSNHDLLIDSSVFRNRFISVFESLILHLKQERKISFAEIARLTNRDQRNIWTIYRRAALKSLEVPEFKEEHSPSFLIPISVFTDRKYAVLESLVLYLKDELNLSNHQIGVLLNRTDKTIWTVYNRVKHKKK